MISFKKKYFLIIETIKDLNLSNIKKHGKFEIIYRTLNKSDKINELLRFRKTCKLKKINFFVANNIKLAIKLNSDGVYISASNRSLNYLNLKKNNLKVIGSAHNSTEIYEKIKQGCTTIFLSRLFKVSYKNEKDFLGVNKFNNYSLKFPKKLVPLGGINIDNLNKIKNVKCNGFAILTELKKKPVKIINRLF